jgi:hypothetical protein
VGDDIPDVGQRRNEKKNKIKKKKNLRNLYPNDIPPLPSIHPFFLGRHKYGESREKKKKKTGKKVMMMKRSGEEGRRRASQSVQVSRHLYYSSS